MKSIKLATGFAVSALALAIAGQATAQAQSSVSFSGDVKVHTLIDFQNNQYTNQQPGLMTADEDWYNFVAAWSVVNGPFSGRLRIGVNSNGIAGFAARENRGGSASNTGVVRIDGGTVVDGRTFTIVNSNSNAQVIVDQLVVTEGPIMFGQLGRVTATAALYERLTNLNDLFESTVVDRVSGEEIFTRVGDESTRFRVDLGLSYSVPEAGLRLQLEAPNSEDWFGVAGAITQNLDVAQVWLDGQYRVNTDGDDRMNSNSGYNVGAAVQADLADPVTVTGVFRTVTKSAGANPQNVLAAQIVVDATDEVSLRGLITDRNFSSAANTAVLRAGATVALAQFTIDADYEAMMAELTESLYDVKVTWADGPLTAFVRGRYARDGFDAATTNAARLTTGASYTTASGIVYGAEHDLIEKGYISAGSKNALELYASYSF